MSEQVEKNLWYSGALISLGVGGLAGFWWAVLCGGALLFGVAMLVLLSCLFGRPAQPGGAE